eukprot:CAMPEP_0197473020 /NCGR_PEP_ID=MMETSP1309-20131121/4311_1 /TAXON_ID=464262 /ORGANISM="Genus nov. species nov., Strain RCC998" /LENGTH=516 /DNA_ID=CAMNT_0043011917 /DNA_START=176 /DNA_END=1723 /DNA_ORIENTATION=+
MSQPLDSSGWSYVVSIPSWTTGSAQGEDNVVYYNVEVKISSITGTSGGAEGGGQQNVDLSRTVQRRFSDFRRLYDMLCMLYGAGNVEQVPDSQAADFTGASSQSEIIGIRREELDKWVKSLASNGQVSWSPPVTAFLQVDQALKEHKMSSQSPGGGGGGFFRRRRRSSRSNSVTSSTSDQDSRDLAQGAGRARNNMPPASNELNELKTFLASETATKEFLAKRVTDLEKELAELQADHSSLKKETEESTSEKMHDLQFEVQGAMNRIENLEKERDSEVDARKGLEEKVESTSLELESKNSELLRAQQQLKQTEKEKEVLLKNSHADVKTLAREVKRVQKLALLDQSSLEKKNKELQRLHQSLREQSVLEEADTSSVLKVLREAEVLHTRMQECNIDKLIMEENGRSNGEHGSAESVQVEEVFQLSDNRISCLLAEVQFLTEVDNKQETKLSKNRQESNEKLRQTLANILIEHAHLHRACNRLIRDLKLEESKSHSKGEQQQASLGGVGGDGNMISL